MKKKSLLLMLSGVLLLGLLAGCGAPAGADSSGEEDAKALRVEKRSCETGETVFLLEDAAQAERFYQDYLDSEMLIVGEDTVESVDGLTPEWEYIVYQEMTMHAGEDKSAGYEEIMRYTLYADSDVITMEIAPDAMADLDLDWLGDILTIHYRGDAEKVAHLKECTEENAVNE